ncbi:hypothetical protein [Chitinophaga sp. XS-30]|uniref:hypothetical protein n=1 Tax=Chitinophaga sp. XS-30 TaxID=2604421 RepID=UPI0011DD4D27|nr:hypothetical protein [Chitinophaga sp. XS-30]QEH42728.1 hypothetical protein FW415_18345 [Chitinophaga sp. XS-30]
MKRKTHLPSDCVTRFFPGYIMLIALALVFGASSCKKNDRAPLSAQVVETASLKGAELWSKMYEQATDEGARIVTESYKALSSAELEEFLLLKTERELKDIPESETLLRQQAVAVGNFRIALNRLSLERHGQPVNKVSDAEMNTMANEILNGRDYAILGESAAPAGGSEAREVTIAAPCSNPGWPTYAPVISSVGGQGYYGEYRMDNDPNATNCDYEYRFHGWYNNVRGERNIDKWVLGSSVSRRLIPLPGSNTDTCILIGYNTKVFWLGTCCAVWCRMLWV